MNAPALSPEQATALAAAFGGGRESDYDVAVAALLQAADELNVIGQAVSYGASASVVSPALLGLENRLRAVAKLAGAIELATDSGTQAAEVQP